MWRATGVRTKKAFGACLAVPFFSLEKGIKCVDRLF
jgi:hypothetical protein